MSERLDKYALVARIDEILYKVWDPIGVSEMFPGDALDEYSSYAPGIASLLQVGASEKGIADALMKISDEYMAMSDSDELRARAAEAAKKIISLREEE